MEKKTTQRIKGGVLGSQPKLHILTLFMAAMEARPNKLEKTRASESKTENESRSFSREVRIRVPFFL